MPSIINATVTSGLTANSDTSGNLIFQTSSTNVLTLDSSQNATFVNDITSRNGLVPGELFYRLNVAYAGSNATGAQSVFGVGVTVSGSTVYQFETVFALSKTAGTTSHLFSLGFGGTATLNNIGYSVMDFSGSSSFTAGNTGGGIAMAGMFIQTASATQINSFTTSTTYYQIYLLKGTISVNAGGTFIPQYTLSAAPGGAYTTAIGSFFKLSRIGASGANTSIGTWA